MTDSRRDMPALRATGLSKEVSSPAGNLTILDDVSLEVAAGESLAIVGASGAGKSTLLGLLAGLDQPTRGRVSIGDADITEMDEDQRAAVRGRRVGFVFQAFHLLPGLSALENVMLPLELAGRTGSRAQARSALERVGLGDRVAHYPRQLSGGEQQRVAIARAFAPQPQLLFADEPTGNLDDASGDRVSELLFEMNQAEGTTLVLVTHNRELAGRCDRQIAMTHGRIADDAQPSESAHA